MSRHLSKIKVIRNTNYMPSGPGSYHFLMQRYAKHGLKPTMTSLFSDPASQTVVKEAADGTNGTNGTNGEVYSSPYLPCESNEC